MAYLQAALIDEVEKHGEVLRYQQAAALVLFLEDIPGLLLSGWRIYAADLPVQNQSVLPLLQFMLSFYWIWGKDEVG